MRIRPSCWRPPQFRSCEEKTPYPFASLATLGEEDAGAGEKEGRNVPRPKRVDNVPVYVVGLTFVDAQQ